jgi:hypothetical protein
VFWVAKTPSMLIAFLSESVDDHGQPIDMTEWIVNEDHDLMLENIFNPFLNASDLPSRLVIRWGPPERLCRD